MGTSKTKIVWYKMPWPRKKEKIYLLPVLGHKVLAGSFTTAALLLHNYS